MCRLLQVLQPLRDLVWLLRGGPPPGPAITLREDSLTDVRRGWGIRSLKDLVQIADTTTTSVLKDFASLCRKFLKGW